MKELHVISKYSEASAAFIHARKRSFKRNVYILSISGLVQLKDGEILETMLWSSIQKVLFKIFQGFNLIITKITKSEFYLINSPLMNSAILNKTFYDRVIVHNCFNGFISSRTIKSFVKSKYYYIFLHDYAMINNGQPCRNLNSNLFRRMIFRFNNGSQKEIAESWMFISPLKETANFVLKEFGIRSVVLENIIAEDLIDSIKEDFYLSDLTLLKKIIVFTYNIHKGRDFTYEILKLLARKKSKDLLFILVGEGNFTLESFGMVKVLRLPSQPYPSVISIMKSVDVVMVNSTNETYSMVAAEARYLGKVLLARDHLVFTNISYDKSYYYRTPDECVEIINNVLL